MVGQPFQPDSEPCQAGKSDLLPCRDYRNPDSGKIGGSGATENPRFSQRLIPPLPSQRAPPQGLGGKLDAWDEDDVGGEDGKSGANNAAGCRPAHGLGRALGIQPRPASDQ